jgi:hypothetical protein
MKGLITIGISLPSLSLKVGMPDFCSNDSTIPSSTGEVFWADVMEDIVLVSGGYIPKR